MEMACAILQQAAAAGTAERDDDEISLTSTASSSADSDKEYEVDTILQETEQDGQKHYLIQWVGYALHECTWEPEQNLLGEELRGVWEDKKRKQAAGEESPFDIAVYHQAIKDARKQKEERHRRRNVLRKAKGLPMTEPIDSDDDDGEMIPADSNSLDDEAEEESSGPVEPGKSSQTVSRQVGRQKIFQGLPTRPREQAGAKRSRQRSPQGRAEAASPNVKRPAAYPATSVRKTSLPKTAVSSTRRPSTTGYQGTARKTSETRYVAGAGILPASNEQRRSLSQPAAGHTPRPGMAAKKGGGDIPQQTNGSRETSLNIFAGGKTRKPRASLKDAMSDSTKDTKLFKLHHTQRLAYKVGRGKEDMAPEITSLTGLFPISVGPTTSKKTQTFTPPAWNLPNLNKSNGRSTLSAPESFAENVSSTDTSVPERTEGAALQKRKSVRFDDMPSSDDSGPAVSMTSPTAASNQPSVHKRRRSTPPPFEGGANNAESSSLSLGTSVAGTKRLSLADYNAKLRAHDVSKRITIGSAEEIMGKFTGIPKDMGVAWVREFLEETTIHFQHSCLAQTVLPRVSDLCWVPGGRLCHGLVRPHQSTSGSSAIEAVAENLRKTLRGLLSVHPAYNILAFPAKCPEWQTDVPGFGQEEAAGDVALKFLIFKSEVDLYSTVRPRGLEMAPLPTSSWSPRLLLTRRVLGWRYNQLLPKVDRNPAAPGDQVFFLAFPESRLASHHSIARWLRENNAACQIYTSLKAGSWQAFRKKLEDYRIAGAVIVHETTIWNLRRFPGLGKTLRGRQKVECWCYSEPVDPYPLFPSMSVNPVAPGAAEFIRLFPHRVAVFLTPSFLITEPQAALELLSWINREWRRMYTHKFVTAHNIYEYLADVANTNKVEADNLRKSSINQVQLEIQANLRGLAETDIDSFYKSASVALELERHRDWEGSWVPDEEIGPLIFAPSCINPNDEQSLVNWFGWWATTKMDRYRKFYVIGSNDTLKDHGSEKNLRQIRLPRYSQDTNGDPDAVIVVDATCPKQAEPRQPEQTLVTSAGARSNALKYGDNGVSPSWRSRMPWVFRSEAFQKESSFEWKAHLSSLVGQFGGGARSSWILYHFPVSWCNSDMAGAFHDIYSNWKTMVAWFDYLRPFSNSKKHSYIGFFWTIPEVWDQGTTPPAGVPYRRHPWLAIYRSVNGNNRKVTQLELIIWDPLAKDIYGDGAVQHHQLMDMQQRLLQMLDEQTPVKHPGAKLTQAWVGGWQVPPTCASTYPIDTTMKFLELVCTDIDKWIPLPGRNIMAQGFRQVQFLPMESSKRPASASTNSPDSFMFGDPMDLDKPADTTVGTMPEVHTCNFSRIFRPPRGMRMPPGQLSRCRNKLFEDARVAGHRDPKATHMRFEFLPTQEWYNEQRAEGRGFEHLIVDNWQTQFQFLKIRPGGGVKGDEEILKRLDPANAA